LHIEEGTYASQLSKKLDALKALMSGLQDKLPDIEVFESAPKNYRMRAEFTVWGNGKQAEASGQAPDAHFIMYDTASGVKPPPRIRVDQFPVGSVLVNELMAVVREEVNKQPALRERLFQANFHTTLSGDSVVTLLYHKQLDDVWKEAARALQAKLAKVPAAKGQTPQVLGRSRKQKVELDRAWVLERLSVNGKEYVYQQMEGSFSQPNAGVCQHMLSWAQQVTTPPAGVTPTTDLLELYCGNGNFTIPLAQNFRRVVATEVAKSGVEAAKYNIAANKADNIFIARMASEEFSEAWRTKAKKRRLEGLGDWSTLDMRTVFVDPPRSGLDDGTVQLVSEFDSIVYISCNPETLHHNLKALMATHKILRFAAFDQFPYTHHLECGVYLQKR